MVWSRHMDQNPSISVRPYNFQCETTREVKGVEKHTGSTPPLLAREILCKFYMYIYVCIIIIVIIIIIIIIMTIIVINQRNDPASSAINYHYHFKRFINHLQRDAAL